MVIAESMKCEECPMFDKELGVCMFTGKPIVSQLSKCPLRKSGRGNPVEDTTPVEFDLTGYSSIGLDYLTWAIEVIDRFLSQSMEKVSIVFHPSAENEECIYMGLSTSSSTVLVKPPLSDLVEELYNDIASKENITIDTILKALSRRGLVRDPTYEEVSERILRVYFEDLGEVEYHGKFKTPLAKILVSPACIIVPVLLAKITKDHVYILECTEVKNRKSLLLSANWKVLTSRRTSTIGERETYIVPYSPTPPTLIDRVVEVADPKPYEVFCDFGSGDGRILVAMAGRGCYSIGIEIDRKLVKKSLKNTRKLHQNIDIIWGDMFYNPLRRVDIVYTFLDEKAMRLLRKDLEEMIEKGTRVVSLTYRIPEMKPTLILNAYDESLLEPIRTLVGDLIEKLREYKIYVYM